MTLKKVRRFVRRDDLIRIDAAPAEALRTGRTCNAEYAVGLLDGTPSRHPTGDGAPLGPRQRPLGGTRRKDQRLDDDRNCAGGRQHGADIDSRIP